MITKQKPYLILMLVLAVIFMALTLFLNRSLWAGEPRKDAGSGYNTTPEVNITVTSGKSKAKNGQWYRKTKTYNTDGSADVKFEYYPYDPKLLIPDDIKDSGSNIRY